MKRTWTREEIDFLKEYYPTISCKKIANILNRSYSSVNKMASRLNVKANPKIFFAEKNEIIKAIDNSASISEALDYLNKVKSGVNYELFKKYCNKYNITVKFNKPIRRTKEKPIKEWLILGSRIGSNKLKKKLYKEGLKQPICEMCEQDEWWNGKKMSLILDHINGISNDNRLENLRIVCPNCNATLLTHCRGYKKIKFAEEKKEKKIKFAEEKKEKKLKAHSKYNNKLSDKEIDRTIKQRTVKRPPYEQLKNEIKEMGYCAVGRKYGVSDNAIRKWVKFYENF